jgi:hypothetical protein
VKSIWEQIKQIRAEDQQIIFNALQLLQSDTIGEQEMPPIDNGIMFDVRFDLVFINSILVVHLDYFDQLV